MKLVLGSKIFWGRAAKYFVLQVIHILRLSSVLNTEPSGGGELHTMPKSKRGQIANRKSVLENFKRNGKFLEVTNSF